MAYIVLAKQDVEIKFNVLQNTEIHNIKFVIVEMNRHATHTDMEYWNIHTYYT